MEARASSEIENIVTTTDKLFQSLQLDSDNVDPATKEALQYRNAIFQGFQYWESWIIYILKGVQETADWTVSKINAIRQLFEQTRQYVQQHAPHIYTHELLNLLFEQPYTRIANLESAGIAKRQTASKYLKELSDLGVLNEIQIGRDKLFINPRLMSLLRGNDNDFAPFPRAETTQ